MTENSPAHPLAFRIPAWLAILVIVLAPLIVFGPALATGKTIGPFDQMAAMIPGGGEPNTTRAWDVLQADGALQFYAWRDLVFESHRTGKNPHWNPYQLTGTPLLSNSQSAPYYPLHLAFAALPTGLAIVFLAWIHLAVAGLGTFAISRRLGASVEGALVAGIAASLCPFAIAWSALASVMTACCWIPVLLAAQLSLVQNFSIRSFAATAGAAVMLLTAGHLQFIFYGVIAWLLFAITSDSTRGKAIITGAAALAIAGFAALPQILPTLEYSKLSHRRTVATAEGYQAYSASAIKPFELLGFLAPEFMGKPGHPDSPDAANGETIPSAWSAYAKPGGNYAESAIWVGIPVALGLCLLGRKTNWRRATPIIAVGVLGLLLAFDTFLGQLFYFQIPGFASTGSPGRAAILVVFAACALAGLGFPNDESQVDPKAKAYPYFALLALALITIAASAQLGGLKSWVNIDLAPIIARRTTEALPGLVIALLLAAGSWWVWVKKGWFAPGALLAIAAHLAVVPTQILPFAAPPKIAGDQILNVRVAYVNKGWDFFTVAPGGLMPPNFATIGRIQDVGGYDSLLAKSTVEVLKSINAGQDPAPPTNGNMMFIKTSLDPLELAESGVTRVYSKYAVDQLTQVNQIGDVRVYELAGPGILTSPQNDAKMTALNTTGFTVQTTGPGVLTARFANLPGWTAKSGDRALAIAEGKWLQVELPDGPQTITFTLTPPGSLPWTWLPALLALISGIFAMNQTIRSSDSTAQNGVQSQPEPSQIA